MLILKSEKQYYFKSWNCYSSYIMCHVKTYMLILTTISNGKNYLRFHCKIKNGVGTSLVS